MVGYAATRIANDPQKDMLENRRKKTACWRLVLGCFSGFQRANLMFRHPVIRSLCMPV
ncbi:UNVERIFIED_ORG: hypothetical protein M2402_002351 [Rahnella aquatilis]